MSRHLIVGLGNPGPKYAETRHNVGFMALERLASRHRASLSSEKFDSLYDTALIGGHKVVLLEPQTYMNVSGKAVGAAARFYDVEPDQIIVLHDEIDLPLGTLRVKSGGGHGGHNGLRDIINRLGARDFVRIRLGVGRPDHGDVTSHVLGKFASQERLDVDEMIEDACAAVETLLSDGISITQNRFN